MGNSIVDIFTALQNGTVALNNFGQQLAGSLLNISGQLSNLNSPVINVKVFTVTGTYNPTAGMVNCIIECIGSGGSGGGVVGLGSSTICVGSGGSTGGYSRRAVSATQIGTSQAVTVAATSSASTAGSSGNAGSPTSVGSLCIANGGLGGTSLGTDATGVAGATAGTGDIAAPGVASVNVYGFGSSPSPPNTVAYGGNGASLSPFGSGGIGGLGFLSPGNGNNATGYGSGGGGGAILNSTAAAAGGSGAPGLAIITEYIIP
jgi:hypothetical protein